MLTDVEIRKAKPGLKPYKLYDRDGLYMIVSARSKRWYMRYSVDGRARDRALGIYPYMSLYAARKLVAETKYTLAQGVDPEAATQDSVTFGQAFEVLCAADAKHLSTDTITNRRQRYERYLAAPLGDKPLSMIKPQDVMRILLPLHDAGKENTAKRVRIIINQVYQDGINRYQLTHNPAGDARRLPKKRKTRHYPHIEDKALLGRLMRDLEVGDPSSLLSIRTAARILPYVFVRPHELRAAHLDDFDFTEAVWRRPAKSKMQRPLIVPLADQVVYILREYILQTGREGLLFPGIKPGRSISEGSLNKYLRKLGYSNEIIVPHGFRGTASTILYEMGEYRSEWIELQLDHQESNAVKKSYNHASYFQQRRKMMQRYADYLDELKASR